MTLKEEVKTLVDQAYLTLDEKQIKKMSLFAELLFDKERYERFKEEATKQGVPFCKYVDCEFDKMLSQPVKMQRLSS